MTEISIRIHAVDMPTAWCRDHGIPLLGITKGGEVIDEVSTEEPTAEFAATVEVVDRPSGRDFRGPYVFGKPGERFLYLDWGRRVGDQWDREGGGRIKLQLGFVEKAAIDAAIAGRALIADLALSTPKGSPVFATVKPPTVTWRLGEED